MYKSFSWVRHFPDSLKNTDITHVYGQIVKVDQRK